MKTIILASYLAGTGADSDYPGMKQAIQKAFEKHESVEKAYKWENWQPFLPTTDNVVGQAKNDIPGMRWRLGLNERVSRLENKYNSTVKENRLNCPK